MSELLKKFSSCLLQQRSSGEVLAHGTTWSRDLPNLEMSIRILSIETRELMSMVSYQIPILTGPRSKPGPGFTKGSKFVSGASLEMAQLCAQDAPQDAPYLFSPFPYSLNKAQTAAQGATCAGIVLGWTSPILPYLQISSIERGETPITSEESSWIASLLPLGALVGALVGGYCADVFGRKWTILGSAIPYFVGLALCAVSTSVPCIYAGRFISGISLGITTTINPIYVDEIAEDSVRGALGIYLELMSNTGVLWSFKQKESPESKLNVNLRRHMLQLKI
uniref:Major facilitator superfamily (MFS) profile domain-containing protein n=1 Tax=Timema monikensis TaxID=170555 RepID=A0A7R9E6M6_9NEOP|nr:unnamed protein product [Timema monikensis]